MQGVQFEISNADGHVHIHFSWEVKWFALTPEQARIVAKSLVKNADMAAMKKRR